MIEQYISELLYKYDSVIVPGLGAFVLNDAPSSIHPVENKISPPSRTIAFDPSLNKNDGILANYLSEKEKVTFFDACSMILDFVEKTNRSLADGKQIILEKIGTLTKRSGIINFIPDASVNYNPDIYGMEEVVSAPILRDDIRERIQAQQAEKQRPVKDKVRRSFSKAAVWTILIVVVIGGGAAALFIIKPDFINSIKSSVFTKPAQKTDTAVAIARQSKSAETDIKTDVRSDDTANADTATVQNNPPQLSTAVESPAGKYYIISGSFRVKENAENYTQTLRKQGYDSQIIFLSEKKMHVVSYNSYTSKSDAEQALSKIRSTVNNSAWLLLY